MMTQVLTGPPNITTHPISQLKTVGMRAILNCKGTGRGSIAYQWEARSITGTQWIRISSRNNIVVGSVQQSQQYRCVVTNEAGKTRSNVTTITVLSKYTYT